MALLAGLREEELKKFLSEEAKILTVRHLERFQLQITAVSRTGKIVRGVLDQKSRITREWLLREKYETPYIVELPNDHPVDTERVRYSVSLPRGKQPIMLKYENQTASTSSEGKPKAKRIRTAAHLLGDKEDYCCKNCFKRFTRKFNLERHEIDCTSQPFVYQCPVCHRKYQKSRYYGKHILQHEAEENQQQREAKSRRLAIEHSNMEEIRKKAEESVNKLSIPYEFGAFL
ncbi:hypothetical protein B9Z55_018670 [Caenorhabditis nigoni]|uniref:C2H2-type domain-containing protein n=1 Tax=Caenorhabditis nigoni TaxID=1611254 RepID=A0A2G5TF86_9PELO|nr:hypothetical protein B9Z55_018670 [Caenorhabditis nigoni]